eukprot:scaffold1457_cov350-Prasinococcus_capsulatus_cf.AAC.16
MQLSVARMARLTHEKAPTSTGVVDDGREAILTGQQQQASRINAHRIGVRSPAARAGFTATGASPLQYARRNSPTRFPLSGPRLPRVSGVLLGSGPWLHLRTSDSTAPSNSCAR